jgi:uncharacterized protein (DUF362 family)
MNEYVKIQTVYITKQQRSVEELAKLYSDNNLQSLIYKLLKDELLDINIINNKNILIKPNWVRHSLASNDEICLRTHDNFLLGIIRILLDYSPKSILIGDAPIQGCNWDKMVSDFFLTEIKDLSYKYNIPIVIKDFRRVTFDPVHNKITKEKRSLSDYVIFDIGKNSYLEPISTSRNNFRVTNYDPTRLGESHKKGVHKYCITKEIFDADIVISVPKIKTHQKTGITGALKNLVGINGDKDYLPHHRIGGTEHGGDCYPGKNYLRLFAEKLLDMANHNIGKPCYWIPLKMSSFIWSLSNPQPVHQRAAGWYGNDTCWRMVMDLNKIAVYGKSDGTLSIKPQRVLYSLCDGIIGGHGDGPLNPDPLALGVIIFSNNSFATDICIARLMNFNIDSIPLLKNANKEIVIDTIPIFLNDKKIEFNELADYSIETIPPPGWISYLKR